MSTKKKLTGALGALLNNSPEPVKSKKQKAKAPAPETESEKDYLMIRLPRSVVETAKIKAAMKRKTMLAFVSELIEAADPKV